MGFATGFQNDIFLSYAHVDDIPRPDSDDGWVTSFEKSLKWCLDRQVGKVGTITLWRDRRRLQGHFLFDDVIEHAVNSSAIFLALTSRGYLESDYCRKELARFHRTALETNAVSIQGRMRIVNGLIGPIPPEDWPREMGRTLGFELHHSKDDDEFGEPSRGDLFFRQVRSLARSLYDLLKTLNDSRREPHKPPEAERAARRVYLATTSDSLWRARGRLIADLETAAVQVVSDVPPPPEVAGEHDRRVRGLLKDVDLSVHLLDGAPGRELLEENGESYPQRQLDLALDHSPASLIWVPRSLELETIEDDRHREFLRGLEHGERGKRCYEFIRSDRADLGRDIVEKLKRLDEPLEEPSSQSFPCMLSTHARDTEHLLKVASLLADRGRVPYLDQYADEPQDVQRLFEERVRKVEKLILFFGAVSRDWVKERVDLALKIVANEGRSLKLGVFLAPPPKVPQVSQFDRPPFHVHLLDNTGGFSPDSILSFLETRT